jgi:hypothetical protein
MASIDDLPPDQRAVLELVLGAGRGYDEIAKILSIDRAGVRERALAGLDTLGPQTRVPPERRGLITDYLLGALPERVSEQVREHLAQSASERAWARAVASELQGIAREPLPEIPSETPETSASAGAVAPSAGSAAAAPAVGSAPGGAAAFGAGAAAPAAEGAAATPAAAAHEPATPTPPRERGSRPTSRVGGAVLLVGGALAVVAVVLVLVLTSGSSKHNPTSAQHSGTTAQQAGTTAQHAGTTPSTSTTSGARVVSQIALRPPGGGSRPIGLADVLRVQGRNGIAIVAQGLTANAKHPPNAYAVWLSNSGSDSFRLGFVNPAVSSNGQLRTAGALPTNASHFQKVLVTLETQSNPRSPGTVVLEGTLTGV